MQVWTYVVMFSRLTNCHSLFSNVPSMYISLSKLGSLFDQPSNERMMYVWSSVLLCCYQIQCVCLCQHVYYVVHVHHCCKILMIGAIIAVIVNALSNVDLYLGVLFNSRFIFYLFGCTMWTADSYLFLPACFPVTGNCVPIYALWDCQILHLI